MSQVLRGTYAVRSSGIPLPGAGTDLIEWELPKWTKKYLKDPKGQYLLSIWFW